MNITFAYTPDWAAVYIDGQLVCDGDEIRHEELIQAIAERLDLDIQVDTCDVDDPTVEEYGSFPEDLDDLGMIK